ncbi:hypothetical protein GCM10029992_12410 [Glycomyces albus]
MSSPRIDAIRHGPDREWIYEQWGSSGRPVLLLGDASHERSAWWPVAARLADENTVAVLDLPIGRDPGASAEALARVVFRLGTRAPVLVGYSSAALVASMFAVRFVTHAVVNIEQGLETRPGSGEVDLAAREALREITGGARPIRCPYLSVFAAAPRPGYAEWLRQRIPARAARSTGPPACSRTCTTWRGSPPTSGPWPLRSGPRAASGRSTRPRRRCPRGCGRRASSGPRRCGS